MEQYCREGIQEWLNTSPLPSFDEFLITAEKRAENTKKLEELMDKLTPFMDAFPTGKKAQMVWKKQGEAWFQTWLRQNGFFLMENMKSEEYDLFFEITKCFLQDVRRFDSTMSLQDCGQALRNVWIIAILQRIFEKPVGYHKAMFAYSMLYPYSDNYLDDPMVAIEEKQTFNAWFTRRLRKETSSGRNHHEEKISALVEMIEDIFDRYQYPEVYESLLQIQAAQVRSLHQQDGKQPLSQKQLLEISYFKGGSSVVADGFLIDGTLREDQLRFCMRYGFMLQIGDDLQDGKADRLHHHQTLVSTCETTLTSLYLKLIQYTKDILRPSSVCDDQELLDFVCKDCLFLLFFAMEDLEVECDEGILAKSKACLPIDIKQLKSKQITQFEKMDETALWKRIDCLIA